MEWKAIPTTPRKKVAIVEQNGLVGNNDRQDERKDDTYWKDDDGDDNDDENHKGNVNHDDEYNETNEHFVTCDATSKDHEKDCSKDDNDKKANGNVTSRIAAPHKEEGYLFFDISDRNRY